MIQPRSSFLSRRRFLGALVASPLLFAAPVAFFSPLARAAVGTVTPLIGSPVVSVQVSETESVLLTIPEGFFLNGVPHHYPTQDVPNPVVYMGSPVGGEGGWYGSGNVRYHKRQYTNPNILVQSMLALDGQDLNVSIVVRNLSGVAWDWWSYANICYKPQIVDPSGGGLTFGFKNGVFTSIGSLVAIPSTGIYAGQFALWVQRPEANPANVDAPLITRHDPSGVRHTGICWNQAPVIGGNFNQGSCMHVCPRIALPAGESVSITGRIVPEAPTLGALLERLTIA